MGQAEGWDPRGRETMYSFYLAGLSSCGSFSLAQESQWDPLVFLACYVKKPQIEDCQKRGGKSLCPSETRDV